jgi:stage V sporulation protein S
MNKHDDTAPTVIKISSKTNPKAAAGSIATVLSEHGWADVLAIGAGASHQAQKAIAICIGYVAPTGVNLIEIPAFQTTEIDGEEKTRMRYRVEPR